LQTYKKRPIYWLFSSGKQRAFECLVYLHRYNEAALSRMRNEYVTPLQGKFSARAEYLSNEIDAATSTSARTKLQKQLDILKKKQVELAAFDDMLRHYADKRIALDLDDGVKVNYGKFGNLLVEVKAITGGASE
jgi:type II restriction/modification system DNA methylase subunit YeeA